MHLKIQIMVETEWSQFVTMLGKQEVMGNMVDKTFLFLLDNSERFNPFFSNIFVSRTE